MLGTYLANWTLTAIAVIAFLALVWAAHRRSVRFQNAVIREFLRREVLLRHRYAEIFDRLNVSVFLVDPEGRLTCFNRAAEKITRYSRDEAFGRNLYQLVVAEHRDLVTRMIQETLAGNPAPTYELPICARKPSSLILEICPSLVSESPLTAIECVGRQIIRTEPAEEEASQSGPGD